MKKALNKLPENHPIPSPSPPEGKGAHDVGGMGFEKTISRETRDLLIGQSRTMRKNPTQAEAFLWRQLREKQLKGHKFRRQHIIGPYIVDFYCPTKKLIIEIDGPIHQKQIQYDRDREEALITAGYQIIRFTNNEVLFNLSYVVERILMFL